MSRPALVRATVERFGTAIMLAAFAGAAASSGTWACPQICAQFLAKYCVEDASGRAFVTTTNPCFACWRGLRILHRGTCQRAETHQSRLKVSSPFDGSKSAGAACVTRTRDPLITNEVLYRLS